MDKLSKFVKQSMFHYPTLYEHRAQVLAHNYLVLGNGVEWKPNGTLGERRYIGDPKPRPANMMDYSDLDLGKRIGFDIEETEEEIARRRGFLEKKRLARQVIEQNIDTIASTPCTNSFFHYPKTKEDEFKILRARVHGDPYPFDGIYGGHYEEAESVVHLVDQNYLPLSNIPRNVEQSFLRGALEIVGMVIRSTLDNDSSKALLIEIHDSIAKRFDQPVWEIL